MKMNTNLKENLQDFIEERIQESYLIVTNDKEYKKQFEEWKKLESNFIKQISDRLIINSYYNLKTLGIELDAYEKEEAYLIGFRDSTLIHNNCLLFGKHSNN